VKSYLVTKTIAAVMKTVKEGEMLTDGKSFWKMGSQGVAFPVDKKGMRVSSGTELWSSCIIEKNAYWPGLKKAK
jgi:hypothetical protein